MDAELDRLLNGLARAPIDRRLDQLEPHVWDRIEAGQRARRDWTLQLRLSGAAVAMAMVVGTVAGGAAVAARSEPELSALAPGIALAPSTLLDSGH